MIEGFLYSKAMELKVLWQHLPPQHTPNQLT